MKNAMRRMALGFVVLAVVALGAPPAVAQEEAQEEAEKSWSVDVAVDYSTLYMFRGINLLGEDQEVLTPSVNVAIGNFNVYYFGYYGSFDAQLIFDNFDPAEIGITPLLFDHTFYCRKCGGIVSAKTCPHGKEDWINLSGTQVRQMLERGEMLPEEFTRPEVSKILMEGVRGKQSKSKEGE